MTSRLHHGWQIAITLLVCTYFLFAMLCLLIQWQTIHNMLQPWRYLSYACISSLLVCWLGYRRLLPLLQYFRYRIEAHAVIALSSTLLCCALISHFNQNLSPASQHTQSILVQDKVPLIPGIKNPGEWRINIHYQQQQQQINVSQKVWEQAVAGHTSKLTLIHGRLGINYIPAPTTRIR